MALTYDQIDAHVRSKYIPILVDQVFKSNPVLVKLMAKNKVVYDSGKSIRVPILYGKKKGGSYSGLDRFDINPVKTRNLAEFEWKGYYTNITIVGEELDMIEGDEKILSLVANEIKEAELKMKDMLADAIFATNPGPKDLNSLYQAVGTGTYGGIAPADLGDNGDGSEPGVWTSRVDTTGGSVTLSYVKSLIGDVTWGTEVPDLIVTTQDIYDAIWAQVQPQQRGLLQNTILAKVGFTGIQIDGTQILVDRHCPAGMMYGINTDYFKFVINKHKNFKWTANKDIVDADAYVRQLLFRGNLICTSRRYHFRASSLTA